MSRLQLPSPRSFRVAATLGVAMLTVAACGGGGESGDDGVASLAGTATGADAATATTVAADVEAQYLAWSQCMAGEGIEVPDLTVDAEGNPQLAPRNGGGEGEPNPGNRQAMEAATEVCGDIPEGLVGGFDPAGNEEFQDAALAFAQCMRDNGVDVPDPDFSNPEEGGGGLFGGAVNPDDPAVQAAMEQCQDLLGELGRGPGATTTVAG